MDSSVAPNEDLKGPNHWRYEDDVFPLTAHPRLLSTWTLIEAWLRILQLLALLGVLTWSMFFLPELLRMSFTSNLNQHAPALKHLQSMTTQPTPITPESHSGPLQQLKPDDSAEAIERPSRSTSPNQGPLPIGLFWFAFRNGIGRRGWGADQLDLPAHKSMANIGLWVALERGCHWMVVAEHIWMVAFEYSTSRPFRRTVLGGPQKRRRVHHRRLGIRQTHAGMVRQRSSCRHAQYDLGGSDRDLVRSTHHPVRDATASPPPHDGTSLGCGRPTVFVFRVLSTVRLDLAQDQPRLRKVCHWSSACFSSHRRTVVTTTACDHVNGDTETGSPLWGCTCLGEDPFEGRPAGPPNRTLQEPD